jgi:hypothetical protein
VSRIATSEPVERSSPADYALDAPGASRVGPPRFRRTAMGAPGRHWETDMTARRFGFTAVFPLAVAAAAAAAFAQTDELPQSAAESRAVLVQSCVDEGRDPADCACLGGFVEANFTPREMAGAALVFSNPMFTVDPAAGIGALLSAGYTLEEITAVVERIVALEDEAGAACAGDSSGADRHD